jgi:hypothetical protein
MRIKIIATIFVCFFTGVSFSQLKFPVYILGSGDFRLSGSNEISVFQFFSDSTFTLTNYRNLRYKIIKSELRGNYLKHQDTLFLNDSLSKFYPFVKEKNYYKALEKDKKLQQFPALIIIGKEKNTFVSYLNIPREIKIIEYSSFRKLEKEYDQKNREYNDPTQVHY